MFINFRKDATISMEFNKEFIVMMRIIYNDDFKACLEFSLDSLLKILDTIEMAGYEYVILLKKNDRLNFIKERYGIVLENYLEYYKIESNHYNEPGFMKIFLIINNPYIIFKYDELELDKKFNSWKLIKNIKEKIMN